MKHFWAGIGLLAVLLALGLWTSHTMEDVHTPIADSLKLAAEKALSGDAAGGVEDARKAQIQWERYRHATASVADHEPMEEADSLFAQLDSFIAAADMTRFAACCARLSELVRAISEAHTLSWWNLL